MLIALFERAVGLYAALININAYHQPGVEAGKKAAAAVLALQVHAVSHLRSAEKSLTVDEVAAGISKPEAVETIFKVFRHLAANGRLEVQPGAALFDDRYRAV
jgi:glucose-6-phosphate isomerase